MINSPSDEDQPEPDDEVRKAMGEALKEAAREWKPIAEAIARAFAASGHPVKRSITDNS